MKNILRIFLAVCLMAGVFAAGTRAQTSHDAPVGVETYRHVLDNGLTVLISEMPSSSVVSLYMFVKAGSATEGKYLGTGISHFLEHMLFKGTKKRGVGAISREIQAMGGVINASTSFDYTIYTITVPADQFDPALDVIADMIMNSKFDAEELEKEREVVYSEIRLLKDRPHRQLSEMVFRTVYHQHPYRIPIIGYVELLQGLARDDFFEYYRTYYVPNNMIFAVAGKVENGVVLPKIEAIFKDFERKRYVSRNLPQEPEQISSRRAEMEYATDLTRMSMSYAGVSVLDDDMFPLDVLAKILGKGKSARLYKKIFVGEKLVRSINASNYTPMDRGVFEVESVLDEENIEATILAVKEQVALVQNKGVRPDELKKAKQQVLSEYVHGQQTSGRVAYSTAIDEAFVGDYRFSQKYVEAIRTVTPADIKRVAQTYLQDKRLSIVILKPKGEQVAVVARSAAEKGEIDRFVLDNGMTILLKENHALPLVAVRLALMGGSRYETADLTGLGELTARLWTQGTKSRTAEAIAESVESRGAHVGDFSGRNSLGIKMNLLSEHLDFGMELLEDLVKNPTFPETEIVKVKAKMKTGILAREDNISRVTSRALRETLFREHPYRFQLLGTLDSVEKITRSDAVEFYQRLAVPNNMVLAVYGDFDAVALKDTLTKRFSRLKAREYPEAMFQEPPVEATREKIQHMDKAQAIVMVGFHGVGVLHQDFYGIEVLSSILGSPFSGRIFDTIRDEFGQSYTLGGGHAPSLETGMIYFYVSTTDEYVEPVKERLLSLIDEIRQEPVSDEELKNMKSYLKGRFQMGIQTNAALAMTTALDELYDKGFDNYQKYNQMIDQVSKEDILRLAKEYLDINKGAIVITRPEGDPDG